MVGYNSLVLLDYRIWNVLTFQYQLHLVKKYDSTNLLIIRSYNCRSVKSKLKKSIFGCKAKNTDIYGKLKTHYHLQS